MPPTTAEDLIGRVWADYADVIDRTQRHAVLASRWDVVDTWARLVVALAASLSAVSLFADNRMATAVFAVATAVASALNAAWDPAQRSGSHRRASRDYHRISRDIGALYTAAQAVHGTGYDPTNPQNPFRPLTMTDADLRDHSARLVQYEQAVDDADDSAPALNRIRIHDPWAAPRTNWGLGRLKKKLARQDAATKIWAEHDKIAGPWG